MRKETKVLVALFGGGFIATSESLSRLITIPQALPRIYWVFPFSVALASLVVLTVSIAIGRAHVRKIPTTLLPAFYLTCCLSVAVIGLSSSLVPGFAAPLWVIFAAQGLLLASAWANYRSLESVDEEAEAPSSAIEWFEI